MRSRDLRLRLQRQLHRCRTALGRLVPPASPLHYWERRARRYGARSVVHIDHSEAEIAAVTERQRRTLLPLLEGQLRGGEKLALDLGCGPGRFTADLAARLGGRAIGLDPIRPLLALAPAAPGTAYLRARSAPLPFADGVFDVVWICQVLGGIVDDGELRHTAAEVRRVLRPGGLLFVVENVSRKPDGEYWRFRSVETYRALFDGPGLALLGTYTDLDESNAVLGGRA